VPGSSHLRAISSGVRFDNFIAQVDAFRMGNQSVGKKKSRRETNGTAETTKIHIVPLLLLYYLSNAKKLLVSNALQRRGFLCAQPKLTYSSTQSG
jgi:hypothetical protein